MSTGQEKLETSLRTHLCGELRAGDAGAGVRLGGWVHRMRDLGGLVFLDLRDRAGLVQVSFDPRWASPEMLRAAAALSAESVVLVEGKVAERPPESRNPDLPTGEIEVHGTSLRVVGPAATPAIPVARGKDERLASEELRLRHRHLDLRRPELQANLLLRHRLLQTTRRHLSDWGFFEIETPILTKPTPEGARDYLVPSRVHPGNFYALPQSPQLYKQLLMISGFDRYFQLARCFRDEDLRAERQPEFTQIDIEASFVERDDVLRFSELLIAALWAEAGQRAAPPFERMRYVDAMERFGCDRPDLRYGLEIFDATQLFAGSEVGFARAAIEKGGRVRGIRVPGGAALSRKQLDEIEAEARSAGAGGLLRLRRNGDTLEGPAAKHLQAGSAEALGLRDGDLCLLVAAADAVSGPALDRVRQDVARRMDAVPAGESRFVWIVDFPLFLRNEGSGLLLSVNHPFTAPHPDDIRLLDEAPERARAVAYDLVYNGVELGGGSIRIGDPVLQERIFALLGLDDETATARFGFLLEALRSGAPPHGGIAFGLDRIAMLLAGAGSLRDVIAFPKTTRAQALFEGAPSPVPEEDLEDLHLQVSAEPA